MIKLSDYEIAKLFISFETIFQNSRSSNNTCAFDENLYNKLLTELDLLNLMSNDEAYKVLQIFINTRNFVNRAPYINITLNDLFSQYRRPANVNINHYHRSSGLSFVDGWFLASASRPVCYGSHNQGNFKEKSKNKVDDILIFLALLALIAVAIGSITQIWITFANSIERIRHNEGIMQGVMNICAIIAGIALTAGFMLVFFSNPVGLVLASAIVVPMVVGALCGVFSNLVQNKIHEKCSSNAIDSCDPHRYRLTDHEITGLEKIGIDVLVVKCMIVAIRSQIQEHIGKNKNVERSLFGQCSRSDRVNKLLSILREIRTLGNDAANNAGNNNLFSSSFRTADNMIFRNSENIKIDSAGPYIKIGEMRFNLKTSNAPLGHATAINPDEDTVPTAPAFASWG